MKCDADFFLSEIELLPIVPDIIRSVCSSMQPINYNTILLFTLLSAPMNHSYFAD